jgi:predicted transposase YdaD
MSGLHQPHDKIVKATFSDIPTARAFLQAEIPPGIAPHIDWSSLRLESGSQIDAEFSASSSDLLYTARLGGEPAYLYILFEHQSSEDPLIALRLLSYMVGIWKNHARKSSGTTRLPPILPLVLAQDNKPWKTSPRFADLIQAPAALAAAIQKHTPDFEFRLVELFNMPFEKILGTPMGILTLRALKAEKISALLDDAVWDEMLMVQLTPEAFEQLLRYILDRDIDKPAFRHKLKSITNPKLNQNAMSLAEQLREEGREEVRSLAQKFRQEGRQVGRQEGLIASKQQDILEAMGIRFGSVPEGLREEIEMINNPAKLTNLLRAAIRCADIESFSQEL